MAYYNDDYREQDDYRRDDGDDDDRREYREERVYEERDDDYDYGDYPRRERYVERDDYQAREVYQERGGYEQARGFPPQQGGYQGRPMGPPPGGYQGRPMGPPPGGFQQQQQQGYGGGGGPRKKSLLIGINYIGSQHQLQGCHQDVSNMRQFLQSQGYPEDQRSQVIMRDDQATDPRGPFFPNGHNLLAAMQWLVSEPGTTNFLHYSGHGGQVRADDDYRATGYDDTIVPVDFESRGQIPSGILHRTLVSRLPPNSTLFVVFDCCHSGSAIELPYVFRADEDGNVSMLDNLQTGMRLVGAASHLIQGQFTMDKVSEAKTLLAGATDFFKGLTHEQGPTDQYGLGESDTYAEYEREGMKNVWMYSGCRDDQTSADASIAGSHVGAMSWAFLECMRSFGPGQSYLQVLQNTRQILKGRYAQVPQLSVGYQQDLNFRVRI